MPGDARRAAVPLVPAPPRPRRHLTGRASSGRPPPCPGAFRRACDYSRSSAMRGIASQADLRQVERRAVGETLTGAAARAYAVRTTASPGSLPGPAPAGPARLASIPAAAGSPGARRERPSGQERVQQWLVQLAPRPAGEEEPWHLRMKRPPRSWRYARPAHAGGRAGKDRGGRPPPAPMRGSCRPCPARHPARWPAGTAVVALAS
jgi:hypothetical protein